MQNRTERAELTLLSVIGNGEKYIFQKKAESDQVGKAELSINTLSDRDESTGVMADDNFYEFQYVIKKNISNQVRA